MTVGEHAAFTIAADEEHGKRSGNASTATDPLARHLGNLGKAAGAQTMVAKKSMMANEM
jgi:hypothetical protein